MFIAHGSKKVNGTIALFQEFVLFLFYFILFTHLVILFVYLFHKEQF